MKETSNVKTAAAPVERVYAVLSDFENLRPVLERAANDEALRERLAAAGQASALDSLKGVSVSHDEISLAAGPAGRVSIAIVECEECKCVKYATRQSPMKTVIWVQMLPDGEDRTALRLTVDADIPLMLRPMIGSKLKQVVEKIADSLAMIQY